jgi:prephenate dehydrogenase
MPALDHDLAVAAISHLPLVAAAAIVEAVASDAGAWPAARALAASGWRDMTRLARGDADMGAGILATNARPIAGQLRALRVVIDGWLAELDRVTDDETPTVPDPATVARLRARLDAAREALDVDGPERPDRDGSDRAAPGREPGA